ncbi:MAG: Uma2 family endonuclease [Acidobacteriota bacterium]|nr:Uma2 family endonuclease [Acidobacteriota bacterium]
MSQPGILAIPHFELVYDDGEPLESDWHAVEVALLPELIYRAMMESGRTDFFVGANIFVYFSERQARDVREEEDHGLANLQKTAFRGPDVFWVGGVDPHRERKAWIAWQEQGRLPDLIVELLSPKTAVKDRTEKRALYEKTFRTREYYLYDPDTRVLEGLRLSGRTYQPVEPDEKGRVWSEQLGVLLGVWQGAVRGRTGDWLRLFRPDGTLVPTGVEQAEAAEQRAEAEHQRAEAADQRAKAELQRAEVADQRAEAADERAVTERLRAEAAEAELVRLRTLLEARRRP